MDFDFTAAEEAFRQELRTWLAASRPDGYDPDTFDQFDFPTRFAIQRNWQRKLAAVLRILRWSCWGPTVSVPRATL